MLHRQRTSTTTPWWSISAFAAACCWSSLSLGPSAHAAELTVEVIGVASAEGSVGCALFGRGVAEQFPLAQEAAIRMRHPAKPGTVQCVFRDLSAGEYAVSAAHDLNDNGQTDRNFVGLPTEPWAVSNNVRPTLRAPRFAEAAFTLAATDTRRIELRLQH
jgi:uncharacterized protein (DUF2141 family)